jgi:hypothetical protein
MKLRRRTDWYRSQLRLRPEEAEALKKFADINDTTMARAARRAIRMMLGVSAAL